jgi:hypothetical protein
MAVFKVELTIFVEDLGVFLSQQIIIDSNVALIRSAYFDFIFLLQGYFIIWQVLWFLDFSLNDSFILVLDNKIITFWIILNRI